MKEKIYRNWLKISIGIITFGIILDIGVVSTGVSQFIVTDSYMYSVFSAIVSVGLLSFSIIALVAGILQKNFYGYKLRELLTFDGVKKRINLRMYIRSSLLQIVFGVVLLSLYFKVSCVNTMICLLLATIFSAGCMAYSVFDIMLNEKSVYITLMNGYEHLIKEDFNKNGKISYHINTLTNALLECCENHNLEEMEKLCELYAIIMHFFDEKEDIPWEQIDFFKAKIQQVCYKISTEFGYFKMIEQIIKIFSGISIYDYWKEDLYLAPILEMKYYGDEDLEKNDYRNQILSIYQLKEYKDKIITAEEWKNILYQYFYVLIKNDSAKLKIKYLMINNYLKELLLFARTCEDGELLIEEEVALYILIYILNSENLTEQEQLFKLFVRWITVNNQYENDLHYFLFLSLIFQLIYYYAYSERNVRTEEYRKRIRKLLTMTIKDDMISGLKVSFLLENNLENILQGFKYRIPDDVSITRTFEACTDFSVVKLIIWTKEFNIKFVFILYCQFFDLVGNFYKLSDFFQWGELLEKEKDDILSLLCEFFVSETGLLQESFIKECNQLGELYNHNYNITDYEQVSIYEWIQNERRKIVDKNLQNSEPDKAGNLNGKKIEEYLNKEMQRKEMFGWYPDEKLDFYIKYTKVIGIMQYLDNSNIDHEKTVAGFVKTFAMQALNWFIKNKCCKFESTYDEKGLENLEKFLENKGYSIRNFSFVSDWTLKRYSQTLPYMKLKEIENAITICRMNGINEHVYAKKDIFKYNIVVSKAKMKNLTDQECLSELERFGRYKEYYYVDGVLLDKRKALESIRRKFYVYEFDFKLYIKFRQGDVVWICRKESDRKKYIKDNNL